MHSMEMLVARWLHNYAARQCYCEQKLFMDARDGRLDSVRKGLKAAGFDLDAQDKDVSMPLF